LVLHVIDSLDVSGGAERQLVTNLRAFDRTKLTHEVALVKRTSITREDELSEVCRVHALFGPTEKPSRPSLVSRLRRLVRDLKPDLLHASLPDAALASRIVGRLEKVATVESLVNISHEEIRLIDNPRVTRGKLFLHTLLDRLTMRSVTGFHAVSQAVADSWIRVVGLDEAKMRVIPRVVETSFFDLSPESRAASRHSVFEDFGLPSDTRLILSLGRVEPQKGQRYLVEASGRILDSHPTARILIVGRQGGATPAVSKLIGESGLEGVVHLVGPRHDVVRFLLAADVFAFPSLFEGNGGNAMIEAMAAGLPIVTTNRAPMTDLIPDDRFGRLVPPRDPDRLAEAINSLLHDSDLAAELGSRAATRARSFPTSDEIASRYESWYSELIADHSK
jgi:glycosyltransferase involved in cell wall biosynthesis